jgi:hypothetical protein
MRLIFFSLNFVNFFDIVGHPGVKHIDKKQRTLTP